MELNVLSQLDGVKPLSDERYMQAHLLFRQYSNQQTQMSAWLQTQLPALCQEQTQILSVGCGTGILDEKLLETVFSDRSVVYQGIDPNPLECAMFEQKLQTYRSSQVDINVFCCDLQSFNPDVRYDIILFVHVLYYFKFLEEVLYKAASLLKPGGTLVILNTPQSPLSRLFEVTMRKLYGHKPWYSEDLQIFLQTNHWVTHAKLISAELSLDWQDADQTQLLLDFILHGDLSAVTTEVKSALVDYLHLHAQRVEKRFFIEHPVIGFCIQPKPNQANLNK